MRTIYKYPLTLADYPVIHMPRGAILLAVQTQFDQPQVWALVDPDEPIEPIQFRIYGTGHPVENETGPYLGTFQMQGGGLVFHVFRATGEGS